jgi:hypothetical protein
MPIVRSQIVDPHGDPIKGALATIRLVSSINGQTPGLNNVSRAVVISATKPPLQSNGSWSIDLTPNASITPANTWYEAVQQAPGTQAQYLTFQVPDGAGPYDLFDILIDPPRTLPTAALSAHINQTTGAHKATAISFDGTTSGLTANNVQTAIVEVLHDIQSGAIPTFTFNQSVPTTEWDIQHNLGIFPNVFVLNSVGDEVEGDVQYIDSNNVRIVFEAGAFSGTAYLR